MEESQKIYRKQIFITVIGRKICGESCRITLNTHMYFCVTRQEVPQIFLPITVCDFTRPDPVITPNTRSLLFGGIS